MIYPQWILTHGWDICPCGSRRFSTPFQEQLAAGKPFLELQVADIEGENMRIVSSERGGGGADFHLAEATSVFLVQRRKDMDAAGREQTPRWEESSGKNWYRWWHRSHKVSYVCS
ncbi:hypothetical protein BDFG_07006 [Blastomyces dermatitidis ATCC 26199]|nr:hypothetical protein BDFG_07006 [Blastomyces dermatitidis ATCC 26199]